MQLSRKRSCCAGGVQSSHRRSHPARLDETTAAAQRNRVLYFFSAKLYSLSIYIYIRLARGCFLAIKDFNNFQEAKKLSVSIKRACKTKERAKRAMLCVRCVHMCFSLVTRLPSVPFTLCEKNIFHFLTEIQTQVADKSSPFVGIIPLKATLKNRDFHNRVEETFQTSQTQTEEESSIVRPQKVFRRHRKERKCEKKSSTLIYSFYNSYHRP